MVAAHFFSHVSGLVNQSQQALDTDRWAAIPQRILLVLLLLLLLKHLYITISIGPNAPLQQHHPTGRSKPTGREARPGGWQYNNESMKKI